jgi:hypothetical protein
MLAGLTQWEKLQDAAALLCAGWLKRQQGQDGQEPGHASQPNSTQ